MYILFFISIFILIIGIIIGIIGVKKYNTSFFQIQNDVEEKLTSENLKLFQTHAELSKENEELASKKDQLQQDYATLIINFKNYRDNGYELIKQEIAKERQLQEERLGREYSTKQAELNKLYWNKQVDLETQYEQKVEQLQGKLAELSSNVEDFQDKVDNINKAVLRQKELSEKEDFYSIVLSNEEKDDIRTLQSLDLKLCNREAIPKIIWDLFVRRPVQEMIKRVLAGRDNVSGIYKVTNKQTGESYIGRSSNISTRWQNHCKTAIGLERAASSTFHNRLAKDGIWNYTWEVLEEVPKEKLPEREIFYIDLYGTKQQLNMKAGG